MASLVRIETYPDDSGAEALKVVYAVAGQIRLLYLYAADIAGLSPAEILTLAQTRADADTATAGDDTRADILENPAAGARQWYIDHPNAALLFELSIDDLDAAIQNRTVGGETLLLKTLAMAVRVLAKREGLV